MDCLRKNLHIEYGVSRQIVSRWENGTAIPRSTKLKIICDEFNISPDILLDEDNSEELGIEAKKVYNIRLMFIIKIVSGIGLFLLFLYIIYFLYKLVLINKINNKFKEYYNWSNYYAKVETFEDAKQISKTELWYKDNKYKIIAYSYFNNSESSKMIRFIDINEKKRTDIIDGVKKLYNDDFFDDVFNGNDNIINYFPWTYDFNNNKVRICLGNILYVTKGKNNIKIKNGKKILVLDSDWITPINYSDSEKEKITFTSYNIELNVVSEGDVEIKEDL